MTYQHPRAADYPAMVTHHANLADMAQHYARHLATYWRAQTDRQAAEYAAQIEARIRDLANTIISDCQHAGA